MISSSIDPRQRRRARKGCAWTKAMTLKKCAHWSRNWPLPPTSALAARKYKNKTGGRISCAALGGRAHAQLVQPISRVADSLGKESRKLPRLPSSRVRHHCVASHWPIGIGSKVFVQISNTSDDGLTIMAVEVEEWLIEHAVPFAQRARDFARRHWALMSH